MLSVTILKKLKNIIYVNIDDNFDSLRTLTEFLANDVSRCSDHQNIKEILLELDNYHMGLDATFFNLENNVIYVKHMHLEDLPEFTTTRTNMIKILDDWHSIWKKQSPYIKITMDENQNVTFTPMNILDDK